MDAETLVGARLDALGLAHTAVADPTGTLRADAPPVRVTGATLLSEPSPVSGGRELPKISVELRGTLSQPDLEADVPSKRERDLEVLRTLGEGGMGRVFLARQHSLRRDVAIKTVRDSASEPLRAALLAEGAITGYLEHPAVIPVHALGVDESGRPLLVMKCVEGAPWSELLASPDHPSWQHLGGDRDDRLEKHLEILVQVCNAVEFAHSRGIVHRDIKPHNVLIGRYGEVYLADWGLALRVEGRASGQPLCGTPAYMAPEMVTGDVVDERTDVFLLGATLHEILTGQPRHHGADVKKTLAAALQPARVDYPAHVPEELALLANDATAVAPDERPRGAAEVRARIADYRSHKTSITLARSANDRVAKVAQLVEQSRDLGSVAVQRDIDILGAEASFALGEALREWPGNVAAANAQRVLEETLDARRARSAELERLARDLDPNVSRVQRDLFFGALAFTGVALSVSAFTRGEGVVTTRALLEQSLAPFGAVLISAVLLRRHLVTSQVNRRTTLLLLVITGAIVLNRALALVAGVDAHAVLIFDCVVTAALGVVHAAPPFRWLYVTSATMLASGAVAAARPEHAMTAFSVGTGASLIAAAFFARRASVGREEDTDAAARGSLG